MARIVLKTIDELIVRSGAENLSNENLKDKKVLNIENYELKSLFSSLNRTSLETLSKRAAVLDATYQPNNFSNYHLLECDDGAEAKKLLQGIGVSHAWKRKGGRGDSSLKFVDIEQGGLFDHESLNLQRIPYTGINYIPAGDHGAGVMGIIMMRDGGSGGIGITPLVKGSVMSLYRPNGIFNTPDAIVSALQFLDPGDILLLECQALDPENEFQLWPIEIRQANFDIIRLATALGITVIKP